MSGKMRNREQFCYVVGCLLLFPAVFLGICPLTWWVGVLCSLLGLCVVILGHPSKACLWVGLTCFILGIINALIGGLVCIALTFGR